MQKWNSLQAGKSITQMLLLKHQMTTGSLQLSSLQREVVHTTATKLQ